MITIVKGKNKIICSKGTYEEQYKQLGYLPISERKRETTKKVASPAKKEEKQEIEEDKKEIEKISEKYGVGKKTTSKKEEE